MAKQYVLTKETLITLPTEIQNEIKDTLKVYDDCTVIFENGRYNVSPAISLKDEYAKDHKYIGVFYADDIYTAEERTENYINEFLEYPIWYKGKRDYAELKRRKLERANG